MTVEEFDLFPQDQPCYDSVLLLLHVSSVFKAVLIHVPFCRGTFGKLVSRAQTRPKILTVVKEHHKQAETCSNSPSKRLSRYSCGDRIYTDGNCISFSFEIN